MGFDGVPESSMTQKLREQDFDRRMRKLIEKLRFPDQLSEELDYKRPYLILFNGITDAIQEMEEMNFGKAKRILKYAQYEAEEAVIAGEDYDPFREQE